MAGIPQAAAQEVSEGGEGAKAGVRDRDNGELRFSLRSIQAFFWGS